jgi:hypothetical protein
MCVCMKGERECVRACVKRERARECLCMCERGVCMCVGVCSRERESVYVCEKGEKREREKEMRGWLM